MRSRFARSRAEQIHYIAQTRGDRVAEASRDLCSVQHRGPRSFGNDHIAVRNRDRKGRHVVEVMAVPCLLWVRLSLVSQFHLHPT